MRIARPLAAALVPALMLLASAQAQMTAGDAPSTRPITLVVPIAAGGGMDTIGRALAERLQERLRQPVVVENRVGAGGVVGVDIWSSLPARRYCRSSPLQSDCRNADCRNDDRAGGEDRCASGSSGRCRSRMWTDRSRSAVRSHACCSRS